MIEERKLLVIAVMISLVGTASLYLYSASQGAEEVRISEIGQEDVGALVELEGHVSELDDFGDSYQIVLKEEGSERSIEVYIKSQVLKLFGEKEELIPGAVLKVKGRLESYQDTINMRVSTHDDIEVLKPAYSSFVPLDSLLQNPGWYDGMNVKVRGNVERVKYFGNDTYFEISALDDGYGILGNRVEGWERKDHDYIPLGRPVVFKGVFRYDAFKGQWIVRGEEPPGSR